MSSPTPKRPTAPTTISPAERRYTEDDLALILNRAAELQEGAQPNTPRYTLAEIQEIAAGAGISREHVASVAMSVGTTRARREAPVLGAPWRFRFDESIDGSIADDVVAELFDLARRELGPQGTISEALGAIEWTATDSFGTTTVTVARRGGRTNISVLMGRTDAATGALTIGGTVGVLASIAVGAAFTVGGTLMGLGGVAPIAAVAGIGIGGGGAWLTMRSAWRHFSRKYGEQTDSLGASLVETARRAVEEGRISS